MDNEWRLSDEERSMNCDGAGKMRNVDFNSFLGINCLLSAQNVCRGSEFSSKSTNFSKYESQMPKSLNESSKTNHSA